jgi:hypothetical protein
VNFRGGKRKEDTHQSVVDPEARLYRKSYGVAARLCHGAHVLMGNRHGPVVDVSVSEANGRSERTEALPLVRRARRRRGRRDPGCVGITIASAGDDAGPEPRVGRQDAVVAVAADALAVGYPDGGSRPVRKPSRGSAVPAWAQLVTVLALMLGGPFLGLRLATALAPASVLLQAVAPLVFGGILLGGLFLWMGPRRRVGGGVVPVDAAAESESLGRRAPP